MKKLQCVGLGLLLAPSLIAFVRGYESDGAFVCDDKSNCTSIPDNSSCTNYNTYLNYTNDIDLMQLEISAMNYIDIHVTNQYCRNYLKTALCVTIYPPCDEGVQKLCSEECDSLLNSGTCSDDTMNLIEHVNNFMSHPFVNFTINCSNSLQFSELLLNGSCPIETCVTLTDSSNVPSTCMQLDNYGACSQSIVATNGYLYKYTSVENFTMFIEFANSVAIYIPIIKPSCQNATLMFACNAVFIPCDLTTGEPRATCSNSCYHFSTRCNDEFDTLLIGLSIVGFHQIEVCADPLLLIKTGFGVNTSSKGVECNCLDDLWPNDEYCTTINKSTTITSSAMFTTTLSMTTTTTTTTTTTEVIDIVTVNGTISPNNATSPNDGSTPVIVASIAGGLLGLCLLVCLVGVIILRKRYRVKKNARSDGFFKIRSNSLFGWKAKNSSRYIMKDGNKFHFTEDDFKVLAKECADLSDLQLPACEVKFTECIGEGAFGCIYKGIWTYMTVDNNEESKIVALKTIKNYNSLESLKSILHESAVMKEFDHPNVLSVLGVSIDTNHEGGLPFIVLPFMANGDLKMYLKNKRPNTTGVDQLPEGMEQHDLFIMCYQIACGMNYLSMKRFVHRDLAARNCMVDEDINIKIADFGLARDVYITDYYRQRSTGKIPIRWMAPEALHDRISSEKTDVWSYGITCWEVYTLGRTPYPTITNQKLLGFIEAGNRPKKPQLCPDNIYSLMLKCWSVDVEKRICFKEILEELSLEIV